MPPRASYNLLPDSKREKYTDALNVYLADLIDLAAMLKYAHWNTRGANFIGLHKLLDKAASSAYAGADAVAERIALFGGIADGLLTTVVARSRAVSVSRETVRQTQTTAAGMAARIAGVSNRIDESIGDFDWATADILTKIVGELDQHVYLLQSHIGETS